jgi:hypothetical protein
LASPVSSAAAAAKAAQLKQVQGDIDRVKSARTQGVASLQNKWLGGEAAQNAISSIKGLPIDAWAQRGLDAVASGSPPGTGWAQWTNGGEVFIQGINDLTDLGLNATLDNITVTATQTAATVKKAAKQIVDKTTTAVETVGSTVTTSLKLMVAVAGLAVVALYMLRKA